MSLEIPRICVNLLSQKMFRPIRKTWKPSINKQKEGLKNGGILKSRHVNVIIASNRHGNRLFKIGVTGELNDTELVHSIYDTYVKGRGWAGRFRLKTLRRACFVKVIFFTVPLRR